MSYGRLVQLTLVARHRITKSTRRVISVTSIVSETLYYITKEHWCGKCCQEINPVLPVIHGENVMPSYQKISCLGVKVIEKYTVFDISSTLLTFRK